jgi:ribosomal protein L37AE/L43A
MKGQGYVRIFESVCGSCGAKDSLVPAEGEEGVWRCRNCEGEFEECDGT